MMQLLPNGKQQFIDINGNPLVGGKVFHYEIGTFTPKTTYQDDDGTIPNTNPVILDARGQASIYGSGTYRQVLKDATDIQIWDQEISDPGGVVQAALDSFKADLANEIDITKGAALVGYRNETVTERLSQQSTLLDTPGIISGGGGDNLTQMNAAIASAVGRKLFIPDDIYAVSARPTNARSVEFEGPGIIGMNTAFGLQQINTYATHYHNGVHKEHLYKVFKRLTQNGQLSVFAYGDSTVAGGNGETAPFTLASLFVGTMESKGISNVLFTNRGVSGTSVSDMNALPDIDPTGANTTDLFIIKYGINDPKDVTVFYNNFRTKLLAIRAATNGNVHALSILLMGPSTTYDIPNGRDAKWYEKLRGVYIALCEEFQCSYYDTYAQIQDSTTAATYWMDNPFLDGRAVHMLDVGQNWIWPQLVDWAFGFGETRSFAKNIFKNAGAASGVPPVATAATSYAFGYSSFRVTVAAGWPFEGTAITERNADGPTSQRLLGFAPGVTKVITRTWDVVGGVWNRWTGLPEVITLQNSWVAFDGSGATLVPRATLSVDGLVVIEGSMKNGTITAGTTLGILPAGMRPSGVALYPVFLNGGTIGFIRINALGEIKAETAANATLTSIDGISFRAA